MKVLMVDVDGVLIHGRPVDGLPLFTYLERDLGLRVDLLQQEFFQTYWRDIIIGREALEPRLAGVLAKIAPHLSAETLIDLLVRKRFPPRPQSARGTRRSQAKRHHPLAGDQSGA